MSLLNGIVEGIEHLVYVMADHGSAAGRQHTRLANQVGGVLSGCPRDRGVYGSQRSSVTAAISPSSPTKRSTVNQSR
jgi:hypothetical protein